jgi:acetylornithine deacetylase/succinyl-diaminopimelate desuccinylase-like protein
MVSAALDRPRFLSLLRRLVALGPQLQNSPDSGLVPREELAADAVLEALRPHLDSGFIEVERLAGSGFESRPSLVLTVQGSEGGTVGLVGAHFDVVPADRQAQGWQRDPFRLQVAEDGTIYGRGVTDCLGHVAVLTELLTHLGERQQRPRRTLRVVLIANEEAIPVAGVGLDYVLERGALDALKDGPVYWLDSTDFGPTVGTGGVGRWDLHVVGVAGHSGMPHNCVNALELAMATSSALTEWFRAAYPRHPEEERYGFPIPSTLKPTVIEVKNRSFTTIPGSAQVTGDIRLTPFYDIQEALRGAQDFVATLDRQLRRGERPPGFPPVRTADGQRGSVRLEASERFLEGIACDLSSPGLRALEQAMARVIGSRRVRRQCMTAALPLVRDLQRRGFDLQITGFGLAPSLHAPNEHAKLDDFSDGFAILLGLLEQL